MLIGGVEDCAYLGQVTLNGRDVSLLLGRVLVI
jgi:hypothetical protein